MDRDFDKEKIIDKMRELREKRDLELLNQDLENINLNSDYQKELPKNKVLNVKYLGTIEIDGEEKGIYLLIEQKEEKDGRLAEIEKYYTEDGELIGANNDLDQFDFITLSEKFIDKDGMVEQLEKLDKEGILDLNEIEKERLEEIARELGIDVKDIEKLAEIDAEKEIEDEKDDKEDEKEVLSKKEVEKISTKTEIRTNQKVTDKDTMASLLNVQGKGYVKIAVVYSDKLQDNKNTTRFSFVGIKEDGSAEKIDTLEQAYGKNPTKNVQTMNRDGSNIKEDKVNSIFRVKGKDEEQLAVNIGPMGTIEPEFVRTPRQKGQKAISIPIETQHIRPTTRETREYMNRSRNTRVDDNIERVEEHQKLNCNEVNVRNTDDNPNNNTHEHLELNSAELNQCANEIVEGSLGNIYNTNDALRYLVESINKSEKNMTKAELMEMTTKKMEEQAEQEHPQHQKGEHQ